MISTSGLIIGLIIFCANILLGSLAFTRNPRARTNRLFFGVALAITLWAVSSVISDNTDSYHLARATSFLAFGGGLLALGFAYLFARNQAHRSQGARGQRWWLLGIVVGSILAATPLVYDLTSLNAYRNGILYVPYLIAMFGLLLGAVIEFRKAYKHGTTTERNQIAFILAGVFLTASIALVTNAVIPALVTDTSTTQYGPLASILFTAAFAYAIIRHRLFDIRWVIARTLGYVGSLVVIAAVYSVLVFGSAQIVLGKHYSIASQIYISAATGLAVLTFGGVKRSFDRWSNRLFYRDAYDTQALFDNLNQTLVASLDLTRLMTDISTLLAKTFKADYCLMGLKESIGTPQRIVGSEKRDVSFKDIMALRKHTVAYHRQVIVADDLEDKKFAELKRVMTRNNIAVLIRLAPNVQRSEEGLGYVALGNKKSCNPYSQQDIRVLETVANELIIAVQNALHFEEIQNFNTTLQEKITDATRQLRRTNEKLKALDETKDDFISMASHQLRTPLTSVKGYVSLVLDGDAGPLKPMQRELLTQAFASSQRMVYLISDLLNVSRLRTGKFVIDPAPVNLADMIEEELAQLKEAAETRSVELSYSKPAHFPTLMLDETKTRQVIMNFVDNAIYYTPAGGHIQVQLADKPHGIELKVVDDGIGVPKHEQHHLFTKFYRAGNARKARPDGTGLGLFMAKKVVVSQGGSILFDSQEGKGSTFGFTFAKAGHVPENTPAATS